MDLLYKQKYIKYKKKYTELKQQTGGDDVKFTTNNVPEIALWGSYFKFEFVVSDENILLRVRKSGAVEEKMISL